MGQSPAICPLRYLRNGTKRIVPMHAMEAYGRAVVLSPPFLSLALDGNELHSLLLYPPGCLSLYQLNKSLGGSIRPSGPFGEQKFVFPQCACSVLVRDYGWFPRWIFSRGTHRKEMSFWTALWLEMKPKETSRWENVRRRWWGARRSHDVVQSAGGRLLWLGGYRSGFQDLLMFGQCRRLCWKIKLCTGSSFTVSLL